MKPSGLTSVFGGNLAIMDIYAAQKMFGRGRKFDRKGVISVPKTMSEDEMMMIVLDVGADDMLVEDETQKSDNYVKDGFEVNLVVVPGVQTGVLLNASRV